jgi:hypothetical protein
MLLPREHELPSSDGDGTIGFAQASRETPTSTSGRTMRNSTAVLAVVALLLAGPCQAQERPMFQPFRIGYVHTGLTGDRLRSDDGLQRELRRSGLMVTWRSFGDGVATVRALHDDEIDVALDIAQYDILRAEVAVPVKSSLAQAVDDDTATSARGSANELAHRYILTTEDTIDKARDGLLSVMRAERRMTNPGGGTRLSHAMIAPGARHVAPAEARSETWICTDSDPGFAGQLVIMALNGELMIEQSSDITQFRVLENNRYALIAEDHSGEFDSVLNTIIVTVSMVTIDKISSRFTHTTALSGGGVRQRSGFCKGFGEGSKSASSQAR